jgi:Saccharopine dehydrogenase NADP binding domain
MSAAAKVVVIGAYGVFGSRLIQLLEDETRLSLLVAGRSVDQATAFVRSRGNTAAQLTPIAFDRNGDVAGDLAAIRPDIVVDASGPFQSYGEDPYRLVQACVTQRVNYLDLADGSDFVAGIGAFDAQAKAAGIYVLSGVSSFPVLTAAAVRRLSAEMTAVKAIRGGIAPSHYARVGENVIRAIAGYAGKPIRRKRAGMFGTGYAWTEHLRYTIAVPGLVPLGDRLFSLVDVPDLLALATLWPEVDEIWMGAAPVPVTLHRVLAALAWLVRLRLLPTLAPIAPLMHAATSRIRWGEHRGGMFVDVEGVDASHAPVRRSWHLLAEGDDGPFIPSMPVEAIIRNALRGHAPAAGARAAIRELELEDYQQSFDRRKIFTGIRHGGANEDANNDAPLYARILGGAWQSLPAPIRHMHDVRGRHAAKGRGNVERGRGLLARLAAAIIGFPPACADVPVAVGLPRQPAGKPGRGRSASTAS